MSEGCRVAFYARVSSEAQARDHTIGSQVAALKERIAADGFALEPDHGYVDDGYSGTSLLRPALEKLRDAVAGGRVERIYVHAPDRLARRYAYQVLLIEEFRRAGVEVAFLNRPIGDTAEDDLLLQVQGMIAEYERAKILERVPGPCDERIEIAVPALVDPAVFEAARAQLAENRKRKRESRRGPRWLLQGLTVCRCCGYAYYAKTSALSPTDRSKGKRHYYRCIGADVYRVNGATKCGNPTVRGDRLEQMVWDQVRALLEDPGRVADEYRRRICQLREGAAPPEEIVRLDRQMTTLRRGIDRLIDGYAGGLIDKAEFEPRITGLKQRMAQLHKQQQAAVEVADAERDLSLVISRLEDFSAKVSQGLDRLDSIGMREIIHTVVRRIEIDHDRVEIIFRVPPPDRPPRAGPQTPSAGSAQHCTDVYARLRRAMGEIRGQPHVTQHFASLVRATCLMSTIRRAAPGFRELCRSRRRHPPRWPRPSKRCNLTAFVRRRSFFLQVRAPTQSRVWTATDC